VELLNLQLRGAHQFRVEQPGVWITNGYSETLLFAPVMATLTVSLLREIGPADEDLIAALGPFEGENRVRFQSITVRPNAPLCASLTRRPG
jgi:hypothetical protein